MHRTMKKDKLRKQISLGLLPYWEVKSGDRVEIFINGVSRGVFDPDQNSKFYSFPVYDKYEDDDLPF